MRIDRRRLVLALAVCPFIGQAEPLIMNYDAPASVWNEALPLGNGRIGVMVFGAPGMERLELNEETYWAGSPHNAIVNGLKPLIDEARRKILAGDADGAYETFVEKSGNRVARQYSSLPYLSLAALCLKFEDHDFPTRYRRSLSLQEAVSTTEYEISGTVYRRESFTSLADDVLAVRLTASRPSSISFAGFLETESGDTVGLSEEQGGIAYANPCLRANSWKDVPGQIRFKLFVIPEVRGGRTEIRQGTIYVANADEVVLWGSVATSFKNYMDAQSVDECAKATRLLRAARERGYGKVRQRHIEKYRIGIRHIYRSRSLIGDKDGSSIATGLSAYARSLSAGIVLCLWPLSAHSLVPTGRAASYSTGHLEQLNPSAMVFKLHYEHQP